MQKLKHSRLLPISGLLLGVMVLLANSGNPPTGKTAAPFNGNCNDCHSGNSYNGNIDVTGFPATADPGVTYDITIKMTATAGSPVKAGFQLVVVDDTGAQANCGDLINLSGATGTENLSGREYVEHRNAKNFAGGVVSWDFQWKAPLTMNGTVIRTYFIVNMCNGANGSMGDNPVWDNMTFNFAGPPPVTATISNTTNISCYGGNNGNATVEASGGNTPYTYLWTGGQTGQTAINLTAGTYTVTVTGANGSGTATAVAMLTQPPIMTLSTSVSGTVTCVNVATATATAGGGTPGFTYAWSDGQSNPVAIFDAVGTYTVTATDANGCTKAASVNITGNTTPPIANAGPDKELTCLVLQVQLNGAGSSTGANFIYNWTTVGGHIVSGGNTLTPTVNACGTYTLQVTNNTNGCTATASTVVTCTQMPPNASATGGEITCSMQNVTLMGNSTTPDVTFSWTGPGITPANQFLQNPVVNQPGQYTLTVSNPDNGCTKTASATVTNNNTPPTAIASVSGSLTCLVNQVQLNLTSNASNPIYTWTGPNNFSANIANPIVSIPGDYIGSVTNPANGCTNVDTVTVVQNIASPGATAFASGQITCKVDTIQLLGNSAAAPAVNYHWTGYNFSSNLQNPVVDTIGSYILVVTSTLNGCTSSAVATVGQNTIAPFDSIAPHGNLNCNNASIQFNATPSSQGPDFKYLWTVKNGGHIVSGDTTLTPTVDSIGKYFLKITNIQTGCTALDSTVLIQSLAVTAAIDSAINVSCNGGANGLARVAGGGGNGMYGYQWSTGGTTAIADGLAAGTYNATVTDGENCTASVTLNILQPDLLIANATATGETSLGAHDGTASANPKGGTVAYAFAWSNGSTTQTISNLAPGTYTVSVTDANGCLAIETVTVNAFGCNLSGSISATAVNCNGSNDGLASVSLTGAVNPVAYAWSNGATTQSVNNLAPGQYMVSVIDGSNCPAVFSANISEPAILSANASATGVTANGATDGTATATPTGGTPSYQYLWSNNASTATITDLAPGPYTVEVTDDHGCTSQQTVNVSAFNCALSATVSSSNTSCFGGSDGQATVVVSGGALPYTYLWSNGATNQTATNLSAGTYTVASTDAGGCAITTTVTVGQPLQLVVTVLSVQNVLCPLDKTGSASIGIEGGTAPYTYNWPGGGGNNLGVGSYTLTVTDANGCSANTSFSIIATDHEPPVMVCPAEIQICGANIVNYGVPSVTDNCGVGASPSLVSGSPSGSVFNDGIHVIVYQSTDVAGNTATCSFSIVVNSVPDILIDVTTNDVNGQNVGAISVTPVGNGPFTYAWNKNGQSFANTEDLTGLGAGSYTLTITDMNSCTSALAPIIITNTVGTSEPGISGLVKLWPNPALSAIQLEIIDLDVIAATIVDQRGAQVKSIQPAELSGEIDIQPLQAGIYCLKISTTNGKVLSLKFVKAN